MYLCKLTLYIFNHLTIQTHPYKRKKLLKLEEKGKRRIMNLLSRKKDSNVKLISLLIILIIIIMIDIE